MPQTKLFITDLDGTLAGDAVALSQFKAFLNDFEQPPRLVYVTGRHLQSALELIEHDELPQPDTLITDIGTAICRADAARVPNGDSACSGLATRGDPRYRGEVRWIVGSGSAQYQTRFLFADDAETVRARSSRN